MDSPTSRGDVLDATSAHVAAARRASSAQICNGSSFFMRVLPFDLLCPPHRANHGMDAKGAVLAVAAQRDRRETRGALVKLPQNAFSNALRATVAPHNGALARQHVAASVDGVGADVAGDIAVGGLCLLTSLLRSTASR